jgi:hypothetical protein
MGVLMLVVVLFDRSFNHLVRFETFFHGAASQR